MKTLLIVVVAVGVAGCIGDAPTAPKLKSIVACETKTDTVRNQLPTGPATMTVTHGCP